MKSWRMRKKYKAYMFSRLRLSRLTGKLKGVGSLLLIVFITCLVVSNTPTINYAHAGGGTSSSGSSSGGGGGGSSSSSSGGGGGGGSSSSSSSSGSSGSGSSGGSSSSGSGGGGEWQTGSGGSPLPPPDRSPPVFLGSDPDRLVFAADQSKSVSFSLLFNDESPPLSYNKVVVGGINYGGTSFTHNFSKAGSYDLIYDVCDSAGNC
ncbi:MAG: hypothetical protein K9L85_04105, partial [Candidatus Peribacteraceae bacterium]|nr:hypothetical protein [Candidatus Peribacteraceae bacterium]